MSVGRRVVGDETRIEWPAATPMVDRNGRRMRFYLRVNPTRPGQQERRRRAEQGERWCRGCQAWLDAALVSRQGVCRDHANAEYRRSYAANPMPARERTVRRKRGVERVPTVGRDYLLEQFAGRCAYCPAEATTWDHVIPVASGGATEPGNIVPACVPCNSSKKDTEVSQWLACSGRKPSPELFDVLALAGEF